MVGLGRIGQGYDYDRPAAQHVFTHARAFSLDPHFQLVGGVDVDRAARERFAARFHTPAFASVDEVAALAPDVVVVATPTSARLASVAQVLSSLAPRALVCEKPLAFTVEEGAQILAAAAARDCAIFVNYMRRTDPTTAELQTRLRAGRIGAPLKAAVWYSRGLYNSASHFVNLLEHLLGAEPELLHVDTGRIAASGDPEPDFALRFAHGTATFHALRDEDYFHNSMEWFTPTGRLRYEQAGAVVDWHPVAPTAPGGLAPAAERLPGDFPRIQAHFTAALARALRGEPTALCTGAQAFATLELLASIQPFSVSLPT